MTNHENQAVEGDEAPNIPVPEVGGLDPVPEVQEEYQPTEEEAARMKTILDAPEEEDEEEEVDIETQIPAPPAPEPEPEQDQTSWSELSEMMGFIWMRDRNSLNPRSVHFLSIIRKRLKEMAEAEKTAAML